MRLTIALLLVVTVSCTTGQEVAPVPPTTTSPASAPTTVAPRQTTTTTVPLITSTTTATTTTTLPALQSLDYEEVASVEFPTQMVAWMPDLSLVATKEGQVLVFEDKQQRIRTTPVLDISGQVHNEGERGLLSIAVGEDPTRVFTHYSDNDGDTVVSEFTWDGTALVDERVLLSVDQPAGNHNGGMLELGPDGGLFLGLGDGGGANDTYGNGQNQDTLLGGLVRIDVDDPEVEPTLFQYGLRNPWRFWIDRAEDLIYVADVGQGSYEEVSVVPFEPGVNHGWPITEGLHCFRPSSGCDTTGLTLPVVEVEHNDAGTCSITGGPVYRGAAIPEIAGRFFYSDYCGGYLRSFQYRDGEVVEQTDWTDQVGVPGSVASFGVDFSGEMYVLTTDAIFKVVAIRG